MINDSRTVFTGSEDIAHASLVHIEAAKLGYFAFVLLSFIKFEMLLGTLDVPVQGLALLGLRWLRVHVQGDRLLQAVASHVHVLITCHFPMNVLPRRRHG